MQTGLFRIRGLEWAEVSALLSIGLSDDLLETALRLESLEEWTPFVAEDRAVYRVSREKRDTAFRGIVLANYGHTCAVTGQRSTRISMSKPMALTSLKGNAGN